MTIEELKAKSEEIQKRVAYLCKFLKISEHETAIRDLESVMTKADFWDDKEKAQETVQKLSSEKNIVEPFHLLQKHSEDFAALEEFAAEDESFLAEADFIVMTGEHDFERRFRIEDRDRIACDIDLDLIRILLQTFAEDFCTGYFISGRPGSP